VVVVQIDSNWQQLRVEPVFDEALGLLQAAFVCYPLLLCPADCLQDLKEAAC
jgi:hypothetical protein